MRGTLAVLFLLCAQGAVASDSLDCASLDEPIATHGRLADELATATADAIIIGLIRSKALVEADVGGGGIVHTRFEIEVQETLKGDVGVGSMATVFAPGGTTSDPKSGKRTSHFIVGFIFYSYKEGDRVLVYLSQDRVHGGYRVHGHYFRFRNGAVVDGSGMAASHVKGWNSLTEEDIKERVMADMACLSPEVLAKSAAAVVICSPLTGSPLDAGRPQSATLYDCRIDEVLSGSVSGSVISVVAKASHLRDLVGKRALLFLRQSRRDPSQYELMASVAGRYEVVDGTAIGPGRTVSLTSLKASIKTEGGRQ